MAVIVDSLVGLGIYTEPKQEARLSAFHDIIKPLLIAIDGTQGGIVDTLLYLGSNDEVHAYTGDPPGTGITISIVDSVGIADGSMPGWYIKLMAGSSHPTEEEWDAVVPGASIVVPEIGDPQNNLDGCTYKYHPFWMRVCVPMYAQATMITGVKLRIDAVRREVGWYASLTGV